MLQNAAFVLVRQDGHKPPLAAAYRGPFKVKARRRHSYLLEGSDAAEDWVAVNRLKPFHPRPEEGEVGLQQLPRRGRPARVRAFYSYCRVLVVHTINSSLLSAGRRGPASGDGTADAEQAKREGMQSPQGTLEEVSFLSL